MYKGFIIIRMKIKIKNKEYEIKNTIRAMFIFEKLANKLFKIETLLDWYIFYYSMILANNPDCTLLFDEFITECDNDPSLTIAIQDYLTSQMAVSNQLAKEETDEKKK